MKIYTITMISAVCLFIFSGANAQYTVKGFGAKADGKTLDTKAIQNAINKAHENGGGVVEFSAGTYYIGTLVLKDNVNLHLQAGAVLLGSKDYRDYTEVKQVFESRTKELYAKYFMIFAEGVKNISITGTGIIHGNGLENFQESRPQNLRPYMIRLVNSSNIKITGVSLLESANWSLHLLGCKDVNIDGIIIETTAEGNRDGLDIDACQGVTVSNSKFRTTDDAIVMKATCDNLCQDITITNCMMSSGGSGVKTGTESNGGFKNITVSNCVITDIDRHAGIELMTVDGGIMQNILLENITMENVATPFFIRLGIRSRPFKMGQYVTGIEDVKDISLNNISVINAKLPSSIMGLHNHKINNVTVSNYTVRNTESQEPIACNEVPFEEFAYPMAIMFENLPAYGLYCRNVEGLHLSNLRMYSTEKENRPALTFDRVDDLELFSISAEIKNPATPLAHLRNVKNITAAFCRSYGPSNNLFELESNTCSEYRFVNNSLNEKQNEMEEVAALPDPKIFEDFHTDIKYSAAEGNSIKGLMAHDLSAGPFIFSFDMTKRGSLQLCLLILNDSAKPEKVLVKYEGVSQEFMINWNEWGWAPITLLKEYNASKKVDFEILPEQAGSNLKIAKVYLRYQDIEFTD